jgi:hypothetical protein
MNQGISTLNKRSPWSGSSDHSGSVLADFAISRPEYLNILKF